MGAAGGSDPCSPPQLPSQLRNSEFPESAVHYCGVMKCSQHQPHFKASLRACFKAQALALHPDPLQTAAKPTHRALQQGMLPLPLPLMSGPWGTDIPKVPTYPWAPSLPGCCSCSRPKGCTRALSCPTQASPAHKHGSCAPAAHQAHHHRACGTVSLPAALREPGGYLLHSSNGLIILCFNTTGWVCQQHQQLSRIRPSASIRKQSGTGLGKLGLNGLFVPPEQEQGEQQRLPLQEKTPCRGAGMLLSQGVPYGWES